jgi:hypothetical protein
MPWGYGSESTFQSIWRAALFGQMSCSRASRWPSSLTVAFGIVVPNMGHSPVSTPITGARSYREMSLGITWWTPPYAAKAGCPSGSGSTKQPTSQRAQSLTLLLRGSREVGQLARTQVDGPLAALYERARHRCANAETPKGVIAGPAAITPQRSRAARAAPLPQPVPAASLVHDDSLVRRISVDDVNHAERATQIIVRRFIRCDLEARRLAELEQAPEIRPAVG